MNSLYEFSCFLYTHMEILLMYDTDKLMFIKFMNSLKVFFTWGGNRYIHVVRSIHCEFIIYAINLNDI